MFEPIYPNRRRPVLPVLLKDFYKVGHKFQYPKDTSLVYSNFTPRSTRREDGTDFVIPFGYQYFVLKYLIDDFNDNFFQRDRGEVVKEYKRRVDNALGPGTDVSHIGELHELGYLPLKVKAVPEGTVLPLRVPALTIYNTLPEFFWLTNMLETLMSCVLWLPATSATTAFRYRQMFEKYAQETGAERAFIPWQGHDFSFRGMTCPEAAMLSGAGHLLSFTGTDTIPAIDLLEQYYGADSDKELIGGSVPATEHSVMSMGLKAGEFETFRRLITEVYPKGIVSIVSDTWDFWTVMTEYLPQLKDEILKRDGKVVIRPDSGDPVKIICGNNDVKLTTLYDPDYKKKVATFCGAIKQLWDVFGGTVNSKGFKVLDPHVGLIYGDSITQTRQVEILEGLKRNGFASSNVVLGIGSYTYQHVTRDTDGWAMKATYGEILQGTCYVNPVLSRTCERGTRSCEIYHKNGQAIFKEPKTDSGIKNSAKGLLKVDSFPLDNGGQLRVIEGCNWEEEAKGLLQTIFSNGVLQNFQTLAQIRAKIEAQL